MPPTIKNKEARLLRMQIAEEMSKEKPDKEKIRMLAGQLKAYGGRCAYSG